MFVHYHITLTMAVITIVIQKKALLIMLEVMK